MLDRFVFLSRIAISLLNIPQLNIANFWPSYLWQGSGIEEWQSQNDMTGFYKHRALLILPPLLLALLWPQTRTEYDWIYLVSAGTLFVLGLLLRIWAQQHLHLRIKIAVTLTTSGPYAIVRNPIYIANTLICVGVTALAGNIWLMLITLVWCMLLYPQVVREEEEHTKQYGVDRDNYYKAVSRWLPRYRGTPLDLTNEHLLPSIWAEAHNFLFPLPYLAKRIFF